jgi:hypothetical protein
LLDTWATVSTTHMGRFGEHSCGMHIAAVEFTEMERHNTTAVAKVGEAANGAVRPVP